MVMVLAVAVAVALTAPGIRVPLPTVDDALEILHECRDQVCVLCVLCVFGFEHIVGRGVIASLGKFNVL
jgi:hypothetical protein